MFKNLQNKWKVNGLQLTLILITFAIGGSLTGYAGRKLLSFFDIDQKWLWITLYIIVIILLWPLAVLLISLLTGQYRFFIKYIIRMGVRMKLVSSRQPEAGSRESRNSKPETRNPKLIQIAIFASGTGSNAQRIIDHFRNHPSIKVSLIACNNPQAGVLKIAEQEKIPAIIIEKEKFFRGNQYIDELREHNIDFIVMAGFLWKLPTGLIHAYPGKIINIHPALLPNYGGKGMYGDNVHAAVIAAGEKESGITIHYVDEHYDNGDIIFQVRCPVLSDDTPVTLAQRIHKLEHENFPRIIEETVSKIK